MFQDPRRGRDARRDRQEPCLVLRHRCRSPMQLSRTTDKRQGRGPEDAVHDQRLLKQQRASSIATIGPIVKGRLKTEVMKPTRMECQTPFHEDSDEARAPCSPGFLKGQAKARSS